MRLPVFLETKAGRITRNTVGCFALLLVPVLFAKLTRESRPTLAGLHVVKGAPDFSLSDTNGNPHNLRDGRGRFVVIEWLDLACPCSSRHYQAGVQQRLQEKYAAKDVLWYSIYTVSEADLAEQKRRIGEFVTRWSAEPTASLLDVGGALAMAYDVKTTPFAFVINPEGKIIYEGALDTSNSLGEQSVDAVVRAENHIEQSLDAALVGAPPKIAETFAQGCAVQSAR